MSKLVSHMGDGTRAAPKSLIENLHDMKHGIIRTCESIHRRQSRKYTKNPMGTMCAIMILPGRDEEPGQDRRMDASHEI